MIIPSSNAVRGEEIVDYWNGRAQSYSKGVQGELGDERKDIWEEVLEAHVQDALTRAEEEGRVARVLDLGCGPGFFSILFTLRGCQVSAVDSSENMLARARENLAAVCPSGDVDFRLGDVIELPFEDGSFDLALARNLTWLMRDPEGAYKEWIRVLRPGGKLLVFDANWYLYLFDPEIAARRRADQNGATLEGWDEEAQATSDEEKRCEEMASRLPLSPVVRPQWDLKFLESLGVADVNADEEIWEELWTDNEKSYYGSSPMFLVEVVK